MTSKVMRLIWQSIVILIAVKTVVPKPLGMVMDAAKTARKLDCYIGMGLRAGGCESADLKNHELRLNNLERAGHLNHQHTKVVGRQVNVLRKVANEHQSVHEGDKRMAAHPSVHRARKMLNGFPDASAKREQAASAWRRVFHERVLNPMTPIDWIQILLGVGIVSAVALKAYSCVRSRRRRNATDIHIMTAAPSCDSGINTMKPKGFHPPREV